MKRVASGLDGAQKERAVLRWELGVDVQAAVVVVPVPAQEALALRGVGLTRGDPARRANHALELGCGRVAGELEQLGLAVGVGDPGQRPHLRIAELPARERRADIRELTERPRDAHMLARRARRQRAAPGHPLAGRATAGPAPTLAAVELGDQLQPAGADRRQSAPPATRSRARSARAANAPAALPESGRAAWLHRAARDRPFGGTYVRILGIRSDGTDPRPSGASAAARLELLDRRVLGAREEAAHHLRLGAGLLDALDRVARSSGETSMLRMISSA